MAEHFDIVIAGGAVMGSSIACHLAMQSAGKARVLVVEPDPSYQKSASALSAGSIRQQFSTAINIDISLHGIAYLRNIGETLAVDGERPDIGLHEGGYLYIATEQSAPTLRSINALQNARGAKIDLFENAALQAQFPWLQTDGLNCGTWGRSGEGWFDGYGLMMAFRRKARSLGVTYQQAKVMDVRQSANHIDSVELDNGSSIDCGAFINAAGASGARALSAKLGIAIPVYAKKRCVFSFTCRDALPRFPLLIDTTGVWVRPEGEGYIAGYSPSDLDEQDHGMDFDVDWTLFDEMIWPALAARVPAFENIRPGRAWAGHYDMCLHDHNALVGRVPGLNNAFLAAGFSGHGLQQSPAVGRGMSELVLTGRYQTLDLADLGCERLQTGRLVQEINII
jgi:FAD-dependent oxidoreductase domain-containing protein 1